MDQGQLSITYKDAVIASVPSLADWLLNDDSVPVKFGLFANDIIPDPAEGATQFVAPLFSGYAQKSFPLAGEDPIIVNEPGTGNTLIKLGAGRIWKPTDETNLPETIYGWFVGLNGSTTTYYFASRFTSPIILTSRADFIEIEPSLRFMLEGINAINTGTSGPDPVEV